MPRIVQDKSFWFDVRVQPQLEPQQRIDLAPMIRQDNFALEEQFGTPEKGAPGRWMFMSDGHFAISRLALDSSDILIEALAHDGFDQLHRFVGPWWLDQTGHDGLLFHVPVRRSFSLTAKNLSVTPLWPRIWMRIAVHLPRY